MEVEPIRPPVRARPASRDAPADAPTPAAPAAPPAIQPPAVTRGSVWWPAEGAGHLDEYDTPAEVDAVFRTQRRIALGHLAVFVAVTLAVPVMTFALDWWSTGRLFGAMSPNFAMAAGGLYVVFLLIGVAAATLASAVEDRMLGSADADEDGWLP